MFKGICSTNRCVSSSVCIDSRYKLHAVFLFTTACSRQADHIMPVGDDYPSVVVYYYYYYDYCFRSITR